MLWASSPHKTKQEKKIKMDKQEKLSEYGKRNWNKYNSAKMQEKRLFYDLLYELAQLIPEPVHENGRPPIQIKDLFFSVGLKLYSNYSGRKICSDLKQAKYMGYISDNPHFNTMFSMDASGFGSYGSESWIRVKYPDKYNKNVNWRTFLKGHILIGTRSNAVCSCEITNAHVGDVTVAPKLLEAVNGNFDIKEVSADKAYSSSRILQIIKSMEAMPYIVFKENANPSKHSPEIWIQMYNYFIKNKKYFMKKYHKRSNVETTFSMVKVRLGEFLKCKNFESQRNELMMKFICHNICCLISQIFDNGVKVDFKKCEASFVNKPLKSYTEEMRKDDENKYQDLSRIKFG